MSNKGTFDLLMEAAEKGIEIECTIKGVHVDSAKVYKDTATRVYVCQNKLSGSSYRDKLGYKYSWVVKATNLERVANVKFKSSLTTNKMNLLQKFQLLSKKEPQRSFLKAGITNEKDALTDDGEKVFLSWLLGKHGDEFKKDVVDPILEGEE